MNFDIFKNKKILIFCPHEDDEINMVGGLLLKLKKINHNIKVVYSTNGDYNINGKYRIREAIKSLKVLGIDKKNIIFLGYPDCAPNEEKHIYMSHDPYISHNKRTETSLPNGEEYHFQKYHQHAILSKKSFILDIKNVIKQEHADIIICADYDKHPDHRALSLSFEKAMGIILKENIDYNPIILKAFAYPTAFFGIKDFKSNQPLKTKFNKNKYSLYECNNPYYNWKNRISFENPKNAQNKLLILNPLFRAMTKHKTQCIYNQVYSIINSDQVFFQRRTDNLLNEANIEVSSGNFKYLNDFMLFDSSNIMNGETSPQIIDIGYMRFDKEDNEKKITINFNSEKNIEEINIYQYVNCYTNLEKVKIIVDNKEKIYWISKQDYTYHLNNLSLKKVKKIEIVFENCKELSLTELELFQNNTIYENQNLNDCITSNKISLLNKFIFLLDDITIFFYKYYFKIYRKIFIK